MRIQQFILEMEKKVVDIDDVLYSFWDDWGELPERESDITIQIGINKDARKATKDREEKRRLRAECDNFSKELAKVKAEPKQRKEKVRIAFNQLFLKGLVKKAAINTGLSNYCPARTYNEMREAAIRGAQEWPGIDRYNPWNYQEDRYRTYEEGYRETVILRTSQMEDYMRRIYQPKAALVCVGSDLCMIVWPERIEKISGQLRLVD